MNVRVCNLKNDASVYIRLSVCRPLRLSPASLHDWMFCVSLLLPGSENRRNKLQGMMSDFPPKPTPPPSVSGQARSGEGKTFPAKSARRLSSPKYSSLVSHTHDCSLDLNLWFRCCHVSVLFSFVTCVGFNKVAPTPINISSGTQCGSKKSEWMDSCQEDQRFISIFCSFLSLYL